jgi:hypothetical protein
MQPWKILMAQRKATAEDVRTQRQKFTDAARKAEASEDEDAFTRALRRVATAPVTKPKKAARGRKS